MTKTSLTGALSGNARRMANAMLLQQLSAHNDDHFLDDFLVGIAHKPQSLLLKMHAPYTLGQLTLLILRSYGLIQVLTLFVSA